MTNSNRYRHAVAMGVASLALLAGAGNASAAHAPSINLKLNAGTLSTDIDSNALSGQVSRQVASQLGNVGQELRSSQAKLRRTARRLRAIERQLNRQARSTGQKAKSDLVRAQRRTQRRVRSLRAKVNRLSRRAMREASRIQRVAIQRAKSTTNGVWLVVTRSGRILDQSGGIAVSREGTSVYRVSWSMSRSSCLALAAGGTGTAPLSSAVSISPVGLGSLQVTVSGATGSRGSGFYLTAAC